MPEKSRLEREKRAKAKGTTEVLKDSDIGRVGRRSAHAAKKSRGVAGMVGFADRSVSPRRPPGEGRTMHSEKLPVPERGASSGSRRKTLPAMAAATYRKEAPHTKSRSSAGERHKVKLMKTTQLKGRKKAPSQMNLKRKGGPRKRMPLHGG